MSIGGVQKHIQPLSWTGYIKSHKPAGSAPAKFTPVKDADGNPETPDHSAIPQPDAKPKKRSCNRCGNTFQPESRFIFQCTPCKENTRHSPHHGAAPGMEYMV